MHLLWGREADGLAATRDPWAGLQGHRLEIGMNLFNEVTELLTRNEAWNYRYYSWEAPKHQK